MEPEDLASLAMTPMQVALFAGTLRVSDWTTMRPDGSVNVPIAVDCKASVTSYGISPTPDGAIVHVRAEPPLLVQVGDTVQPPPFMLSSG